MQKTRIVLKVGSSNLSNGKIIDKAQIKALAQIIYELRECFDVILVSSGAMASGYTALQIDKNIMHNKQALASIGQPLLMESYREAFREYNIYVAQLLLVWRDFDSRKHTAFAQNTIDTLLAHNVLPIINENDTIATDEMIFGDNDRLGAYVAHYFGAKLLVILSDIDGYFDKNPHQHTDAKIIPIVHSIPQEALQGRHSPHAGFATGGIVTKLLAADFLLGHKGMMFLSNGRKLDVLRDFLLHHNHRCGTLFCPAEIQNIEGIL